MNAEELGRRIASYPRWNQQFHFDDGVSTPLSDRELANRQQQRYLYFFERLLGAMGGSLRGCRVLDLGCNAGLWSLAALDAGADFVLGLDVKQEFIEQAQLVFEAKAVDPARYHFRAADVFAESFDREFDIVLCLGLMDQVDRPVELFEQMAQSGAQVLVIDTNVSRSRASLFETTRLYDTNDTIGDGLVLLPSRGAVADLAKRHGFATVALAQNAAEHAGMSDYRRERRCAFICTRDLDTADIPAEQRPALVPWWVRDPGALLGVG